MYDQSGKNTYSLLSISYNNNKWVFDQSGKNTWVVYQIHIKHSWRTSELAHTNTTHAFSSPDWLNMNLFQLLFHTTHNKIIITHRANKYKLEKVHSNVIMHCDAMICSHSNVITHCDIIMDVPSNVITHCDVIMSGCYDVILIDLNWPDWSPFGEHVPVYHIKQAIVWNNAEWMVKHNKTIFIAIQTVTFNSK